MRLLRSVAGIIFLYCVAFLGFASAQTANYHLHTEASNITFGFDQLLTAGPDGASTALTVPLASQNAGNYLIKQFETQAGVPNSPGIIPNGSTLNFRLYMRATVIPNGVVIKPFVQAKLNSATGTSLCSVTGSAALTTTVTQMNLSCTTSANVTMTANDRFYLWVGVNTSKKSTTAYSGELDIEGTLNGNFDSQITLPLPPASISSISPNSGAVGSSVTITGANFGSAQGTVKFGGVQATTIASWDTGQIVAIVPSTAPTGAVVVTLPGGTNVNGPTFTVTPAPAISGISPNSGPIGSSVTITGTNFGSSQGSVSFNGTVAATITSWLPGQIVATVASGTTSGAVTVTALGGVVATGQTFTVTPNPSIGGLSPSSGTINTSVTITGSNFGTTQGTVTFNNTQATNITTWADTRVVAVVPANASTGPVVITVPGGVGTTEDPTFTVLPSISGLSRSSGEPGDSVTISGTTFGTTAGTVTFNGRGAVITSWTNTSIVAIVPDGASSGNVVVTNAGAQAAGVPFTVLIPTITTLSLNSGLPGASVTITGSNFGSSGGNVTFNGQDARISSWSDGSIVALVPSAATTGNVMVSHRGLRSNGVAFTVMPSISALLPNPAPIGASVSIVGSGFGATQGTSTVTFNGITAAPSSWSGTQIVVPVPNGATTGNVVVTITGSALPSVPFTVSPGISNISPSLGPTGTRVLVAGTSFGATQGTSTVTFNGVAATVTSWSNTAVGAIVPTTATSGNVIITVSSQASNGKAFTVGSLPISYSYDQLGRLTEVIDNTGAAAQYIYDPVGNITSIARYSSSQVSISGFSPQNGLAGTTVTISGSNFSPIPSENQVSFNGTGATVVSATSSKLVVTVPSGATSGPIAVTSPVGSGTSSSSFAVGAGTTPRIDSLAPNIVAAGTSVTVQGANFDTNINNDRLLANQTPTVPTLGNATQLSFVTPVGTGSGHITVIDSAGAGVSSADLYIVPSGYSPANVTYTGRTTVGTPATVSLSAVGNIGMLLVDGVAGQQLTVQFSGNSMGTVTAKLYDFNATLVGSSSFGSATYTLPAITVSRSATYTLLITSTAAGSITVLPTLQGGSTNPPTRPTGSVIDLSSSIADRLVALFMMNEGSGTTAQNVINGHLATLSGSAAPLWSGGPSISFAGGAGLNSYLDAGTDLTFDQLPTQQITVVSKVWVNAVQKTGIVQKSPDQLNIAGVIFGWDANGALQLLLPGGFSITAATAPNVIVPGQWLQVAFTWDGTQNSGSASLAHFYVNGIEQTKLTTQNGSPPQYQGATNQPFRIGSSSAYMDGSLNGRMAYLAVYKGRILTGRELLQLDAQLPVITGNVVTGSLTANGLATTMQTSSAGAAVKLGFTGAANQQATIQFSGNTLGAVSVNVANPDGSSLVSSSASTSAFSVGPVVLPSSGGYVVTITPAATATGSITASLQLTNGLTPVRPVGASVDKSSPLAGNLAGLFLMNEGNGPTRNLVNNQTANLAGTVTPAWWNSVDPSIVFGGGGSLASYVDAGTDLIFDQLPTQQMSVVSKVWVNGIAQTGIAQKSDTCGIGSGFFFYWDSNGELHLQVNGGGGAMYVNTAPNVIVPGQWLQVAFTWDGTQGGAASAAHLFVNGIEQAKTYASDGGGIDYHGATNAPFRIGTYFCGGANDGSLNGKMAYMAVYKGRTLSPAELNQLDAQLPVTIESVATGTLETNGPATTMQTTVAGQVVKLGFTGSPNQQATIQFSGNTLGAVTVNLIKPDGAVLGSTSSSAASFSLGPLTLPIVGGYTVRITPGANATGTITAALQLTNALAPTRPYGSTIDSGNALAASLVGLYLMNEGSGTTTKNVANNQTANISGTLPPAWNITDPSLVFKGGWFSNSYVDAGMDPAFNQLLAQKMTIATRIWVNGLQATSIAQKDSCASNWSGFLFYWDSYGALQAEVGGDTARMYTGTYGNVIVPGQWIQVAFTWDGTQGGTASAAHFYVNGVEQTKTNESDGINPVDDLTAPFLIGSSNVSCSSGFSFNGKMAYMAIYKGRILTPTELNQLDSQLPIH